MAELNGQHVKLAKLEGAFVWHSHAEEDELFLVRFDGSVARSSDAGRSWSSVGAVNEQPAAFDSANGELYVALHDGTVLRSGDGGRSWQVRSRP